MSFDYDTLALDAAELVEEFGREMTFVQFNQTPADTDEPWKGPVAARTSPVVSVKMHAVVVDVGTAKKLGMAHISEDLIKRTTEFLVVAPGDSNKDLGHANEVLDGSLRYSVLNIDRLKPAGVTLLYYLAVSR